MDRDMDRKKQKKDDAPSSLINTEHLTTREHTKKNDGSPTVIDTQTQQISTVSTSSRRGKSGPSTVTPSMLYPHQAFGPSTGTKKKESEIDTSRAKDGTNEHEKPKIFDGLKRTAPRENIVTDGKINIVSKICEWLCKVLELQFQSVSIYDQRETANFRNSLSSTISKIRHFRRRHESTLLRRRNQNPREDSNIDNPEVHDGQMSRVFAACFHPKNNYELLTGGWDDVVQFWDLRQPHAIRHLSGVHMCGEGIDINQKGTEILTCSWQKEDPLQVFDYGSAKRLYCLEPDIFTSKLYCGKYVTKDFVVCAGTDPNLLRVVDLQTTATTAFINQLPGAVYGIDVGPSKLKREPSKTEKYTVKSEIASVPKIAFISGTKLYQVDFY